MIYLQRLFSVMYEHSLHPNWSISTICTPPSACILLWPVGSSGPLVGASPCCSYCASCCCPYANTCPSQLCQALALEFEDTHVRFLLNLVDRGLDSLEKLGRTCQYGSGKLVLYGLDLRSCITSIEDLWLQLTKSLSRFLIQPLQNI